jgi:uncharacterized lipoprotein YmbA
MKATTVLMVALGLGGCAAPALHTYVLGASPTATARPLVEALPARVIELRPVLLPDHLDSRDILRRMGPAELVASRNGRWGDRLSVGIRQTLAADLQARLPEIAVVTTSPIQQDFRRVSLTVTAFDLEATGTLTLDASWTIEATRPVAVLARRRARFAATGVPTGDAAQVAAMSRLLEQLATAMARDL